MKFLGQEIGIKVNAQYLGKVNIWNLGCRPVYLRIILLPLPAEIVCLELGLGEIGQRGGAVLAGAQLGLTEELHLLHVVAEDRVAPLELGSVRVVLVVLSHKGVEVSNALGNENKNTIFIGPESDHWQRLSLTDSLTD